MPKKIPMRMCVGCRDMFPKKQLLRIVRSPEGEVSLDPIGKKSGRGAYVCRQESCLMRAIKQRQLDRALETPIGPEVTEQLRQSLSALPKETDNGS